MNWYQSVLMSMGIGILKMALPMITGELREMMEESIGKWKIYAETTPYDWDNLVVEALETLLNLDVISEEESSADIAAEKVTESVVVQP